MSFANKLSNIANENKPKEISALEHFKNSITRCYPGQMELIKEHCLALAKQGKREYGIYGYDSHSPCFNPDSLWGVKLSEAKEASNYAKGYIAHLLEQEGFIDYDIEVELFKNSVRLFDDNWRIWISCVKIRW